MKTFWNLLLCAILCFTITSCDKDDDRQPAELLVGQWTAVASEGWTKDGETVTDQWTWKSGDPGTGTHLISDWWKFLADATGECRSGKLTWILSGDELQINTSSPAVIALYRVSELSDSRLVLTCSVQNPVSGSVDYEKVTYGRK